MKGTVEKKVTYLPYLPRAYGWVHIFFLFNGVDNNA